MVKNVEGARLRALDRSMDTPVRFWHNHTVLGVLGRGPTRQRKDPKLCRALLRPV